MPRQESWDILDLGSWIPAVSIETETFQLKRPAFEIFEESSEWRRGHYHCEAYGFYCIANMKQTDFVSLLKKKVGNGRSLGGGYHIYIYRYICFGNSKSGAGDAALFEGFLQSVTPGVKNHIRRVVLNSPN